MALFLNSGVATPFLTHLGIFSKTLVSQIGRKEDILSSQGGLCTGQTAANTRNGYNRGNEFALRRYCGAIALCVR